MYNSCPIIPRDWKILSICMSDVQNWPSALCFHFTWPNVGIFGLDAAPVKYTSFVAQFVDCFWCTDEVLEVFEVTVFSTWSIQFAIFFSNFIYHVSFEQCMCYFQKDLYIFFIKSSYHHDLKTRVVFCVCKYVSKPTDTLELLCFLYFCIIYFEHKMLIQ